jgi:diadenosine tetraphosphatase ApaH/serine/threonine PP2A family protein phosphatase
MRYLVLTDVHANLEALEACLAFTRARGFDRTLVLGDLVGYGPDPNVTIDRIMELDPIAIVRGNHDKVACGIDQADGFNAVARMAARWTLDALTPANRDWLAALPVGPVLVDEFVEICHGSPFDEDAYIFDELDAVRALKAAQRPLCLFGHTHYPVTFELSGSAFDSAGPSTSGDTVLPLKPDARYLVNPGSVGQPRDGDARAACAIVDVERRHIELFRVPYAVSETQGKIVAAGLPEVLAQRLGYGR